LAKYDIDPVAVQKVRWVGSGGQAAEDYVFLYGNGNEYHRLGTGFIVNMRIISRVKRVEFIRHRVSYIIIGGRWCDIVPNVNTATEDEKKNFDEELWPIVNQFQKYHTKICRRF
jgi:hypothetical protein